MSKTRKTATEAESGNADFQRMMTEQQAKQDALAERSLRIAEQQAEGLHALAAALREVGLAIVASAPTRGQVLPPPAPKGKPPEPKSDAKAKAPELADVRKAIIALAAARTSDVAFEVLKRFGVEAIADLRPEQFGEVIAAARAAVEAGDQ